MHEWFICLVLLSLLVLTAIFGVIPGTVESSQESNLHLQFGTEITSNSQLASEVSIFLNKDYDLHNLVEANKTQQ